MLAFIGNIPSRVIFAESVPRPRFFRKLNFPIQLWADHSRPFARVVASRASRLFHFETDHILFQKKPSTYGMSPPTVMA